MLETGRRDGILCDTSHTVLCWDKHKIGRLLTDKLFLTVVFLVKFYFRNSKAYTSLYIFNFLGTMLSILISLSYTGKAHKYNHNKFVANETPIYLWIEMVIINIFMQNII